MRGRSLALIWPRPAPIHLIGAKSILRGRPVKTMRSWPPGLDALAASGQRSTMKSKRKNPRMSGGFVTAGVPGLEPRTNDSDLGRATPLQLGRNPADFCGFHGSSVRAGTDRYGLILVTQRGIWFVSGHGIEAVQGRAGRTAGSPEMHVGLPDPPARPPGSSFSAPLPRTCSRAVRVGQRVAAGPVHPG